MFHFRLLLKFIFAFLLFGGRALLFGVCIVRMFASTTMAMARNRNQSADGEDGEDGGEIQ